MKIVLVLMLTLYFLLPAVARANDNFDFRDSDKQLHILASYGLATTTTMIFKKFNFSRNKSIVYSSLLTLAVGALKEYGVDKSASSGDMIANGVGTASSALIIWTFEL